MRDSWKIGALHTGNMMHTLIFALQQMLAILAATIAVPAIVGNGLTPATAMFGAGIVRNSHKII